MELSPLIFFIIIIALFILRNILDQKKAQKKREELARQKRQLNPRDKTKAFVAKNSIQSKKERKPLPISSMQVKLPPIKDQFSVKEDTMVSIEKMQPILTIPSEKALVSFPDQKHSSLKKLFDSKGSKRKAMIISEVLKNPYISNN